MAMDSLAARQADGGRAQSLFRAVNEQLDEFHRAHGGSGDFVCECASHECVDPLSLTHGEYEAVRAVPTHFAVKEGHDVREFEHVVATHEGFVVVEKFGAAAEIADLHDPRRRLRGNGE